MGERLLARLDAIVHHLNLVRGTNIVPHLSYDRSVSIKQAYCCGAFET